MLAGFVWINDTTFSWDSFTRQLIRTHGLRTKTAEQECTLKPVSKNKAIERSSDYKEISICPPAWL